MSTVPRRKTPSLYGTHLRSLRLPKACIAAFRAFMKAADQEGDHRLSERGEAIGHMLSMLVRVLRVPTRTLDIPKKRMPVRVFLSDEDSAVLDSLSGYFGVSDSQVVWLAMMLELSVLGHYQTAQEAASGEGGAD